MSTSLLSLPDELLALVVDHALGEYAPRLYEERQQTACALALVNKRVGGIAQAKLLEAVHISLGTEPMVRGTQLDKVPVPSRARALHVSGKYGRPSPFSFASFAAVRDLRMSNMTGVSLDEISQLRELRTLVLWQGTFVTSRPFVALGLKNLQLYFCDVRSASSRVPFTATGCPEVENLYLACAFDGTPWPVDDSLLDQVDSLGLEMFDGETEMGRLASALRSGLASKEALLEKTLFDLLSDEIGFLLRPVKGIKHVRIHAATLLSGHDSAPHAGRFANLADAIDDAFPSLETLYLPLALDTSHVMLHRYMRSALTDLVDACARQRVEIVFEHALDADELGEDRASPHFEARCRRIKAERAAAQGAQVQQGGARAA
ncbi:hypothetical protein JCM9279_006580 [Rhodotorula babjevae]